MYVYQGTTDFNSCSFSGNTAQSGGDIYAMAGAQVTIVCMEQPSSTYGIVSSTAYSPCFPPSFPPSPPSFPPSAPPSSLPSPPPSVSPSPPLSAEETPAEADPCFPSRASVTKSDGTTCNVGALKEGDKIVAATAEGSLTIDTVSLLSIAKPKVQATFVNLTTDANTQLTLTPGHHLSISETCCSTLKKAKDVVLGEKVWAVEKNALVARTVVKMELVKDYGLHSPVLTNGGFPIVNGVVTSFDAIEKVTLAKYGLTPLLKACKAMGTCESVRDLFLGDDRKYIA